MQVFATHHCNKQIVLISNDLGFFVSGFPLTETSITGAIVSVVSFISGVLLGYCVRKRRQRQSYNIRQAVAMTGRYATGAAGVTLDDLSVLRNKSKRSSPGEIRA